MSTDASTDEAYPTDWLTPDQRAAVTASRQRQADAVKPRPGWEPDDGSTAA
jgi:hypothetical protein